MLTGSVIFRPDVVIVCTPMPAMLKSIAFVSSSVGVPTTCACSFEVSDATDKKRSLISIASRNVRTSSRASVSSVELTVMVATNSERSSKGSKNKRRERAGERRLRKGREGGGIGEGCNSSGGDFPSLRRAVHKV